MKVHVLHIDDRNVEVTLTPGWLGRLFGAKVRRGPVYRDGGYGWKWKLTDHRVSGRIVRDIQCTPVEDLPKVTKLARFK